MNEHQSDDGSDITLSHLPSVDSDTKEEINSLQRELKSKIDKCNQLKTENESLKLQNEEYKRVQELTNSDLLQARDKNNALSVELAQTKAALYNERLMLRMLKEAYFTTPHLGGERNNVRDKMSSLAKLMDHNADELCDHNDSNNKELCQGLEPTNTSSKPTEISVEKRLMQFMFGNRKPKINDHEPVDNSVSVAGSHFASGDVKPITNTVVNTVRSVEDPRINGIRDTLHKDDMQEVLSLAEDPFVREAKRKHLNIDTSIGAISSIGFKLNNDSSNNIVLSAPNIPSTNFVLPDEGTCDLCDLSDLEEVNQVMDMVREYSEIDVNKRAMEDDEDAVLFTRIQALKGNCPPRKM